MAKGAMGWLTPDQAPVGFVRRTVSIPDSPAFIQAVNGALYELALEYNWQADGFMTPEQCQEFMQAMWLDYLESKPMLPKRYISGLQCDVINASAVNIIKIHAGECRDATDENDLTLAADMYLDPPSASLTANTWYKVIYSTIGGSPAPKLEGATYSPVAFERHIGWIKTQVASTAVIRQKSIGGNFRTTIPQDSSVVVNTQCFQLTTNPPIGYSTLDIASYVPPSCVVMNATFRLNAPSVAMALRYREYGRTYAGTPVINNVIAGDDISITIDVPIVTQKFDIFASTTSATPYLIAWVNSYTYEV